MASLQPTIVAGNINATGNITATNFIGNAAQLTNIGRSIIVATRSTLVTIPITSGQYLVVLTRSGNANVVVNT
jgi:hypothetical protein